MVKDIMWNQMKKGMLYAVLVCLIGLCACGKQVEDDVYSTEVLARQGATEVVTVENIIADTKEEIKYETIDEAEEEAIGQQEVEVASKEAEPEIIPADVPAEITIRMVGDILLHDRVSQYAKQEDEKCRRENCTK